MVVYRDYQMSFLISQSGLIDTGRVCKFVVADVNALMKRNLAIYFSPKFPQIFWPK